MTNNSFKNPKINFLSSTATEAISAKKILATDTETLQ